tara:strand:- start:3259 stop:3510 length:252 start_codon:yes stop_codon:yes gene_type:complete
MDIIFQNILNDDMDYYIFKILHKTQLNEVFDEFFGKIKYHDILEEIVEDYDCNYYITFKRGKLIATLHYPIHRNGTGWIIYLS